MNTLNRLRANGSTKLFLFFLALAVVLMAGCAGTENFGRLVPDDNVNYYSGPDASPKALIGIQNEFRLESNFWKPVELTHERLKRWFEKGGMSRLDYDLSRNGAEILAPDGRQIGIWYAMRNWRDRATIKMIDNNTVNVSTPIERNESKNRRKMIP